MATFYTFTSKAPEDGKHGEITFNTNNDELFDLVNDFILVCLDATKYRNRVEEETTTTI